jgi:RNA polymerase sigma-70 factor (ECF subfamily)
MANERPRSRMDPERERGLVVRARVDAEAYGVLYDHYLPRVYGFVARRTTDRTAAEEITTICFQRGLETIQAGAMRTEALGGWLFRVAAQAIVDRARRPAAGEPAGVRAADLVEPGNERAEPLVGDEVATNLFAAALDRDDLRAALRRLTEPQRRVVVLKYLDDLTDAELCGALGVSATQLSVRVERALRALNAALAAKGIHAA